MTAQNSEFLMPAEWLPHLCCWMAWPHDHGDWPVDISRVRKNFTDVLMAIAEFEPVQMIVDPADRATAKQYLPGSVDLVEVELDDCWMRDMGPTMVRHRRSGELYGIDWRYNGWGKFPHEKDQNVARRMLDALGYPAVRSDLVNEGGALHVNGEGWGVLTKSVQLNANRNPQWTIEAVELELQRTLGIDRCLWLQRGLVDDDTDGHVDELMCFTDSDKALVLASSDPADANYTILQQTRQAVGGLIGGGVTPVEQPPAAYLNDLRLSRSYVNLYIANGGIVMPSYNEADYDREAYRQVASCFPDRKVIQVDCSTLVTGGGNIHCITQQCPALGAGG